MSMTFSTNQAGGNADYMRYVSGPISKTDKINSPDLLDFTLVNYDGSLVKLARGAHIVLTTDTYGVWFSGYVVNDPQLTYLGTSKNTPQWGYIYEASGEEYMLNQKPFGIVVPFINTTQGAILKRLISLLTPAGVNIDTTGIQDGLAIPRFIVDPNKHFTEIVQGFAKAAHYQFRCKNFVATYAQQDASASVTIDANNQHFTPSQLNMQPSGDPIINDSIVLGGLEPQKYVEEFFMGDGATAQFPLVSSVFGLDSTLLLQDDMSSSTIDSSKWTIYDPTGAFLQPYGGTLNVLGGSNNGSLDVSLQSQSLVPIEGQLRMTHGEWDFIGGTGGNDGVLGGLWTGQTVGSMAGCLCGIKATPVGSGSGAGTVLHPVVNGVVDLTQSATVDYSRRYVMRTLLSSKEAKRSIPSYSYRDTSGTIHNIVGSVVGDHFFATTVITELDPITALTTNQWTWTSDLGVLIPVNAYYVPVASNNLNLTVQSITISVPMQASLKQLSTGDTTWKQKVLGQNEVDSLDGMAPSATIVDSNNGASTRNSLLGSANYNPGQATLTYFKDTAQLLSYLPAAGDLVHLSYRGAGAAIGRARSKASISVESASWRDDGVRSETKRDLSPLPMTSQECEMAAAARVNDNCYQHWTGTYTIQSGTWLTGQPLSGSLVKFLNLPSQFPSYLSAETITDVKSTLVSLLPTEQYTHSISFGPTSSVENVLASIKSTNDVFTPQDTAEIPQFVDVSSIGGTSVASVPTFVYTSKDSQYWYFSFADTFPLTVGGLEIRYSDNGWGADNGNNLLSRLTNTLTVGYSPVSGLPAVTNGFAIPRTVRGAIVYLRLYDKRNLFSWSEDITKYTPDAHCTTGLVRYKGPNNSYQMIGTLYSAPTWGGTGVSFTGSAQALTINGLTFTTSVLGPVGTQINVGFNLATTTVTCTGAWQRVSFFQPYIASTTVTPVIHSVTDNVVFHVTAMSLEVGTKETIYCKTNATAYGVTSRFSSGLHTAFPLIPPSPSSIGDFTRIDAPVISAILPANLTDVWGVEIREADNKTVLFHTDLDNATLSAPTATGDTSMVLSQVCPALAKRSYKYYVYTYNLFGEYSPAFVLTGTIDPPSVTNLNVVNETMMVEWTGNNATAYEYWVDKTDMTLTDLSANGATINTFYQLTSDDFTNLRYIAITPYDALGPGETMGGFFEYQISYPVNALSNPSFEGLPTPVNAAFGTATTGGTLAAGTYSYRVLATDAVGSSLPSVATVKVVPAGTSTNTVTVNWAQVTGATGYKVYGRVAGSELLVATIASGTTVTWTDTGSVTPSGAVPTSNTSDKTYSYTLGVNWGVGSGHQCYGSWAAYIAGSLASPLTGVSAITNNTHLPATPGVSYYAQCMIDGSRAKGQYDSSSGQPLSYGMVFISFYNSSNVLIGSSYSGNHIVLGGLGWNLSAITQVAPAGASYALVGCSVTDQSSGTVFVDDFYANPVPSALVDVPDGPVYVKLGHVSADHSMHVSTALNPQGSILPNQPIPLTYTYSNNSINVTCPTVSLLRADGSTFTVPGGTTGFTGLSDSTTYYLYPYILVSDGTLHFANPSPPSSTPSSTQALQANQDGCIGLGVLTFTTLGTGGNISGITGFSPAATTGSAPPGITIVVSGDGTGGGGSVSWASSGLGPFTWTPTVNIAPGTGYTYANAVVTVDNSVGDSGYSTGTTTYSCSIINVGTAGGSTTCPEAEELVDVLDRGIIRVGDVVAGDYILGYSFKDEADIYRRVLQASSVVSVSWRLVQGYRCSPTEPVYVAGAWTLAYRVTGSTFDTFRGYKVSLSVETDEYDEQNYYLVTGETPLLIHNVIVDPC